MKLVFNNYQEIDNVKLYLRKNLLEDYLNEEEKKILKGKYPKANRYILTSEKMSEIERDYMRYEENVFTILYCKEILIKKDDKGINVIIEEPKGIFVELKEYLKSQNILIRDDNIKSQEEKIKRLENANKIGEIIL